MEIQQLREEQSYPSDIILKEILLDSYEAYLELTTTIYAKHQLAPQWRYYKDGKAWLCKVCYKKKTVFWLSIWNGFYKTSFFFTEKTSSGINELDINELVKNSFKLAQPIGKLIPLVLDIKKLEHLSSLQNIIEYKLEKL